MYLRFLLFTIFVVALLNFCKVEASPVKNKAAKQKTNQTADINTKRDTMSSPPNGSSSMDAGTIMQQLLKDYEDRQNKKDNPEIDTPTTPDAEVTLIKERITEVTASLDALVKAVENDDSIYDEIKKNDLPAIRKLLQQLQDEYNPKDPQASAETFSKLLAVVESMANKVVEQNDDGKLRKLLDTLSASLHKLSRYFPLNTQSAGTNPTSGKPHIKPDISSTTSGAGTSPDLNGVDSAIAGQQEA